jgi:8-oxo-dGTP diphosphatase
VLTSPYLRCLETVKPLAAALGVGVELSEDLAEGADLRALDLTRRAGGGAVLCTHGDVALDILNLLHRQGAVKGHVQSQKGSTWVLELDGDQVRSARYLPPK